MNIPTDCAFYRENTKICFELLYLIEGKNLEFKHTPIMLNECINGLKIKEDGIYVDGTLWRSWTQKKEILRHLSSKRSINGIDRDEEALKAAKENLKEYNNVKYIHGNHDDIKRNFRRFKNRKSRWNFIRLRSFVISAR